MKKELMDQKDMHLADIKLLLHIPEYHQPRFQLSVQPVVGESEKMSLQISIYKKESFVIVNNAVFRAPIKLSTSVEESFVFETYVIPKFFKTLLHSLLKDNPFFPCVAVSFANQLIQISESLLLYICTDV